LTAAPTRIGLYGGSFDPVHLGHLRTAFEVCRRFSFDHLRFVPSGNPPHRAVARVAAAHRVAMLRLAVDRIDGLEVDEREIHRDERSYSIDTIRSVQADHPDARIVLVIGMDQFCVFDTWHEWQHILASAELVVMERPGEKLNDTGRAMLNHPGSMSVQLCSVTQLDISSSRIRRDLEQEMEIDFLVPYDVQSYIKQNNLYGAWSDSQGNQKPDT
jgi:nicotinate-nucleotide adenylyltransferase